MAVEESSVSCTENIRRDQSELSGAEGYNCQARQGMGMAKLRAQRAQSLEQAAQATLPRDATTWSPWREERWRGQEWLA